MLCLRVTRQPQVGWLHAHCSRARARVAGSTARMMRQLAFLLGLQRVFTAARLAGARRREHLGAPPPEGPARARLRGPRRGAGDESCREATALAVAAAATAQRLSARSARVR